MVRATMKKARQPSKASAAAAPKPPAKPAADTAAETAFRKATVVRGDAARSKNGKLPPGATFELEGFDESGTPVIKRRRFSIG